MSDTTTRELKSVRLDSKYTDADERADQAVKRTLALPGPLDAADKLDFLSHVLARIVKSSPHLNQYYAGNLTGCLELLKDQKLLKELEDAWDAGKFANIRRWGQYRH